MTLRGHLLLALTLASPGMAWAAPPMPPKDALDLAVANSPAVAEARAAGDEASGVSQVLRSGPHEWTLRGTSQNRDVVGERGFREWETGLETGWRLPAKRKLDLTAAAVEGDRAASRIAAAERDTRRALLEAWFSCVKAEVRVRLAHEGAADVARLGAVANQRFLSGDGSDLERKVAAAEIASADAEVANAEAIARASRQLLSLLGLETPCVTDGDSDPPATTPSRQVLDPAISLAESDVARARVDVERARADRVPDPVIGIKIANERGGAERIVGVTFSVPLPGGRRQGELARATAHARRIEKGAALAKLQHRRLLDEIEIARETSLIRRRLTRAEAVAREDAAGTMARAYGLGDGELALVAAAKREARRARASAEDAFYDAWLSASISQLYGAGTADHGAPNAGS